MRLSARGSIDPFIVMDVMAAAARAEAAGRSVIHLEIGQPATPAPAGARRALAAAMEAGPLGYTPALGLPELRRGIAALYRRRHGIDLDPARVIVTNGSSSGFLLAFTALFDAGDRVAHGEPGYACYRKILGALSVEPVGIQTEPQNRFQPVPSEVEAIPGLAGLIVASPNNPTGTMLSREALAALAAVCADRGVALVSDEIYHGIDYGTPAVSALEVTDDVYVINSFSKYFSMTGWRIGWMVVPEAHVRDIERLAQNFFICAPHASQIAALAALDCEAECAANLAVYAENRRILLDGLPGAGLAGIAPPDGGFYLYADVAHLTGDSGAWCGEVLERAGVALTPGLDFDAVRGHRTVRFAYAAATAEVREALVRLTAFRG